jgi:hypothetical protein
VSAVATKHDLDDAVATLRGELASKQDLANELERFATKEDLANELERFATKQDLANELERFATKQDLDQLRVEVAAEIRTETRRSANSMEEQFRTWFTVLLEKFQDLPETTKTTRADLDAHCADTSLHVRTAAAPPKRVAQPASKPTKRRSR